MHQSSPALRDDPFAAAHSIALEKAQAAPADDRAVDAGETERAKETIASARPDVPDTTSMAPEPRDVVAGASPAAQVNDRPDRLETIAQARPQKKKPGRRESGRPNPLQAYVDDDVDEFINATYRQRRANGEYWVSKAELVNALLRIAQTEVRSARVIL